MSIIIKTEQEIELIRESCRLLAIVHRELEEFVRPGISTKDIDIKGDQLIRKLGAFPRHGSLRRATLSAWTRD